MKILLLKPILALCLALYLLPVFAQNDWKLTKDKDGIRVFESATDDSNYKNIKVECTMQGDVDDLIHVLTDVEHHKDWIYNNKEAYLLKRINRNDFYYYTETSMPWPMSNRDAVVHMKINKDTINNLVDITEVGEPTLMPQKSGMVRVLKFSINWHVTTTAPNQIHIVYIMEADPGGNVPAWLANTFIDRGPYESFRKLNDILKHDKLAMFIPHH